MLRTRDSDSFPGTVNTDVFEQTVVDHVVPVCGHGRPIFLQDNAAPHTAKKVADLFAKEVIEVIN